MTKFTLIIAIFLMSLITSCANMGRPFKFQGSASIQNGKTTKEDVQKIYGQPFRVGVENGKEKWTYGQYQYRVFGDSTTRDLNITFNEKNIVEDYSYSSSFNDEVQGAMGTKTK